MSTSRDRSTEETGPNPASSEVGYGRPPQAYQFKPGQCGNPQGRPKGSKNETTILNGILNRKVDIRQGGKSRKITVLEAILTRITEDALKGNTKSAAFLFNRVAGIKADEASPEAELSADDRAVLDAFTQEIASELKRREDGQ
jgi:hypothetical protein